MTGLLLYRFLDNTLPPVAGGDNLNDLTPTPDLALSDMTLEVAVNWVLSPTFSVFADLSPEYNTDMLWTPTDVEQLYIDAHNLFGVPGFGLRVVTAPLAEIRPGTYRGTFSLPMTGQWQLAIHAGDSTVRVPLQTEATMFIQSLSPWRVTLPGIAVVLLGMGFAVDGLRRMDAGVRGSWPELGAGTAFVIIGVVLALRAVS